MPVRQSLGLQRKDDEIGESGVVLDHDDVRCGIGRASVPLRRGDSAVPRRIPRFARRGKESGE